MGELLGLDPAILVSPAALLGLVFLCMVVGMIFPRPTVTRLWKELDDKEAENKELRSLLDKQTGLLEKVTDQLGDMKVTAQATLYAMQEIQAAGRYAAGMDPLPRTAMQKVKDKEA